MQNKAREFIQDSTLDFFPSLFQEKKFIDTVEKLTIFIETKNSMNDLRNIYLKDDSGSSPKIIIAKKGQLISKDNKRVLRLYDGNFINMDRDGKSSSFNFEKTDFNLSKFATKSTTYRKIQETNMKELFKCANYILVKKLPYVEKYLVCNNDGINEIISEIYIGAINHVLLLRILSNKINRLLKIKEQNNLSNNLDSLINACKPPIFWKEKPIVKQQLNIWNLSDLKKILSEINDTEIMCKKNPQISNAIFFNLFSEICKKANNISL